ncbi:MAG: hypothetical protein WBO17_00635 [Sphingorhabdus sp.]
MDNLARPQSDDAFGASFARDIISKGSLALTRPLVTFLDDRGQRPDLRSPAKTARAALIADIAHFMNILHGRLPGVVDHAAKKIMDDSARKWLVEAIDGFAAERSYLNNMTVIAGHIRRLNGQDRITALVRSQSRNFEMLATSDRKGCPAGAAIAFVIDWHQSRSLLNTVALHVGLEAPRNSLPSMESCVNLAQQLGNDPSYRRAMAFGSEQLLAQQRGLWHLIAARHTEILAS